MHTEMRAGAKNLMASTWTKAAKIRRAFNAGRRREKDLVLTPKRAILEASLALDSIQTAMREAGLPEEDVKVGMVLVNDEYLYATQIPPVAELSLTLHKILELEGEWRPLGLVYCQEDREAGKAATWVQSWLVDETSVRTLIAGARNIAEGNHGQRSVN